MGITKGSTGVCPHCKLRVRFEQTDVIYGGASRGTLDPLEIRTPSATGIEVVTAGCPACGKPIVTAKRLIRSGTASNLDTLLWPDSAERPVPQEVEAEAPDLAADFREAVSVFSKSKKASAALSRRCLQYVLTHKGGATAKDLAGQIDQVLGKLPEEIAVNVDAIRHVGNFAAHPVKSKNTGEIADVEEGEAEWLLDVLEDLFSYYYVTPARAAARREELNKKLQDLGKPPLKTPDPT